MIGQYAGFKSNEIQPVGQQRQNAVIFFSAAEKQDFPGAQIVQHAKQPFSHDMIIFRGDDDFKGPGEAADRYCLGIKI